MSKGESQKESEPVVAALADIAGAIRGVNERTATVGEVYGTMRVELARELLLRLVVPRDPSQDRAAIKRARELADAFVAEVRSDE